MPSRVKQIVLLSTFIPLCWLAFQGVHELGHVIGAVSSGGHVTKVVLHPLAISRTDINPNPCPLLVAWSGPVLGAVLPVLAWAACQALSMPGAYLLRFFAGFCLIANGLYIAVGSLEPVGDALNLLRYGSPSFLLWLFGLLTTPLGFLLWHNLGPHFGLGDAHGQTDSWAAIVSAGLLLVTLLLSISLSSTI